MEIDLVPIQVPIIVRRIDMKKTEHNMFIVITDRKLSPCVTIFDVSHSAGL